MANRRYVSRAAIIAVAALLSIVLIGRRPVLVRLEGNTAEEHAWYILNPLRNREPERAAEQLLHDMQAGRCAEVSLRMQGFVDTTCTRETELRIVSWRLRARDDKSPRDTTLLYDVKRNFGPPRGIRGGDPYWVNLQKQGDGSWKVVSFERWF